jgi:hypothetical protein
MTLMGSKVLALLRTSLPSLRQSKHLWQRPHREQGTESQSSRKSLLFLVNSIPLLMWRFMRH